jgi:hypothetical protein
MIRLAGILPNSGFGMPLFPVHDSIVFEVPQPKLDEAVQVIRHEMTTPPFETFVQFFIEIEVGPNLGEVVPYEHYHADRSVSEVRSVDGKADTRPHPDEMGM